MKDPDRFKVTPRYSQFRQAVRRYAPSKLLPALSEHAAQHLDPFRDVPPENWGQGFAPWFYSAVARESIIYGNEFRSQSVTEGDLLNLRNLFVIAPSGIEDFDPEQPILARFVQSHSPEQLPYQTNIMLELARSYLLFGKDLDYKGEPLFPRPTDWVPVLGGTIPEALNASFVFTVGAYKNKGTVDPAWLDALWFEEIESFLPRSAAANILDYLTATVAQAKEDGKTVNKNPHKSPRYAYNPLVRTPIIDLGEKQRFAPQPYFIHTAMSPDNLYYRGIRVWEENTFGQAVGLRVQDYVGRQLRHTGKLDVRSEFRWTKNRFGGIDSSDWFIVTPRATILIECKSARMSPEMRGGTLEGLALTAKRLTKAYEQLNANAIQLRTNNPAFKHLPNDRPLIGLVVTSEPIYGANSSEVREKLPTPELPILSISLGDVETLAVLPPDLLGEALHSLVSRDTETYMLSFGLKSALPEGFEIPENTLLRQAYEEAILPRLRANDGT